MKNMFTSVGDPAAEAAISEQMEVVVGESTKVYGSDCTVILSGGFGRGEGSVRWGENGYPLPIHDFDLYLVTDRKVDPAIHASLEARIMAKLRETTGGSLSADDFVLGLQVIPLRSLNRLPPDISNYELKAASTVIYGSDVRPLIPGTSKDVALASGARTLFHRTTSLLKNVEPEYLESKRYPLARQFECVYECCKIYTEICTALSLLGGFYEPSYRLRAVALETNYQRFPALQKELPDLAFRVKAHTEMKLQSDFSPIISDPAGSWLEARRELDICLRFFLSKFLSMGFYPSWSALHPEAEKRLKRLFFYDYLSFYLNSLGIRGTQYVYAANILFQAYDSYSFRTKTRKFGKFSPGGLSLTSPILNIYLSSALVLFSLRDNGSIDNGLLRLGRNYLRKVLSLSETSGSDKQLWVQARDACVDGQRVYFGIKQRKMVL